MLLRRENALGAILGERFLMYRIKSAPACTLAHRAIEQGSTWKQDQRQALRRIVVYLDTLLPVAPPTPAQVVAAIAALVGFTARARSPVFFDARRGETDLIPEGSGAVLPVVREAGEPAAGNSQRCS